MIISRHIARTAVVLAALVQPASVPLAAQGQQAQPQQGPSTPPAAPERQTHWDAYRNRPNRPSTDQQLMDPALQGAIDLHAHHDPDSYPRQWDAIEIVKLAQSRGMRGVVLKNHWTETAGLAYLARKYFTPDFEVFGSVTLDTPVGGVNPQAVRYMADVVGGHGRIVWLPTHDSDHEVRFNKETRPMVSVSRDGQLSPQTLEVIKLIAQHDLTLATGHVTPPEALQVLRAAKAAGVTRMIVTHPLLAEQFTFMNNEELRAAADLGAFIEITAGSITRQGPGRTRVLEAMRLIGPARLFVASDSGLVGTPNHPDALALAARALRSEGYSEKDLDLMFKDNPAFLVRLPPLPRPAGGR